MKEHSKFFLNSLADTEKLAKKISKIIKNGVCLCGDLLEDMHNDLHEIEKGITGVLDMENVSIEHLSTDMNPYIILCVKKMFAQR